MIKYNKDLFKGILTINSYGCSGSGLMLSLLDGHPNCIGFQDTLLAGYQDWWNKLKNKNGSNVLADFLDLYEVMFNPSYKHPTRSIHGNVLGEFSNFIEDKKNGVTEISVPKEPFIQCLNEIVDLNKDETASDFFKKIHIALGAALGKDISSNTIIVHGSSNMHPHRAEFIKDEFKNVWNMLMVRDPVISHYAQIKRWIEDPIVSGFHDPNNHIVDTLKYMQSFYFSIEGWKNCTRAVRVEDVHNNFDETMNQIINWLNIPWSDNLKKSTFLDINWNFSNNKIHSKPINPKIISKSRYKYLFTDSDYHLLSMSVWRLYKKWNYIIPNRWLIINILTAILSLFKRLKVEKDYKVNLIKIIEARLTLLMMLFNINKISKKSIIIKIFGRNFLNKILKLTNRKIDRLNSSSSIIELLK